MLLTPSAESWIVVIVADCQAEASWVNVLVAPKEESAENGLGHDVQDAVEDGFRVGSDDVAAFG
jgi:hypothetical protein